MTLRDIRRALPQRAVFSSLPILALLFLSLSSFLLSAEAPASASDVNHPTIAVEDPRRDTPLVLDGTVYASVQLEDRIIVAGEFSQVESVRNGPIVTRTNIFAYDINTGAIIDDFAPTVDGKILTLIADESDDSLYLGGTFKQIDGEFRIRLAKLNYFGELDPIFRPEASAQVLAMDIEDDQLYLGGSFLTVNGEVHDRIAAIDTTTGATSPNFNYAIAGDLGKTGTRAVKALDVTPDGNRLLVVFNGQSIVDNAGVSHDKYGVGFISLINNNVTAYRTQWFENSFERCSANEMQLRDGELSPDGSMFVVVEKGNFHCDKAVAFPAETNGTNNPLWVTAAHDSVFSVGITNNAVYIGGHFCFIDGHGPISSDDAATYPWVAKPEACDITNGNSDIGEFAARQQIAALDPATGEPLDWNPKSRAQVAVWDIEPIDRGLLIGQDTDRINTIRTGHHAFLDFGGTTPPYQPPLPDSCTASVDANSVVTLNWDEIAGDPSYIVRRNGSYLADATGTTFSDSPVNGTHEYVIRYRINGVTTNLACNPTIEIASPAFSCTAVVNADAVTVSWVAQPGVDDYSVRRNGGWLASSTGSSYTDDGLAPGSYAYQVRYRSLGVTNTVDCSPVTVEVQGESFACTADGGNLSWNQLTGVSTYQVRKNGSWFASTEALSFSDIGATNADSYEIRFRQGGVRNTISCN